MLMNPSCNRLSLRQATRRVTQLCDQALAPLDLRATQLSMLREIDRLGPIALNPLAEAMVMDRATPDHNVRSLEMRVGEPISTAGLSLQDTEAVSAKVRAAIQGLAQN